MFSLSFNPDIFESNVINIIILLGGIIYLGSGYVSTEMANWEQEVLTSISESEEQLQNASTRLSLSQYQFSLAPMVLDSMLSEGNQMVKQLKIAMFNSTVLESIRYTTYAQLQSYNLKVSILNEIADLIITLLMLQIIAQLEKVSNTRNLQIQANNNHILKLGS